MEYFKENENIDNEVDVFKIIKKFNDESESINISVKSSIDYYYGRYGLILPILKEIILFNKKNPKNKIKIVNINQFNGKLNIWTFDTPEYICEMISKAEIESMFICEICGARGNITEIGNVSMTLCEHHLEIEKKKNKNNRMKVV